MPDFLAAQALEDPDAGTILVEVAGAEATVLVGSGITPTEGDVLLVSKIGNRWWATAILYDAPVWTPPTETPPPTTPPVTGTNTFSPIETRSWRGSWRTDNTRVYQGQWQGYGNHHGCAFYGGAPTSLAGKTVTSASIRIKRLNGGGWTASQQLRFALFTETHRPGGAPTVQASSLSAPALVWGQEVDAFLHHEWAQELVNGTAGGLGLYEADGDPYIITLGLADWAIAWQLTINWTA